MDRQLRRSGTLPQRVYNEFASEIDLKSPDGVMRSGEVDRYIESALKPLIEEGKAFKHISINRRTGIRTTRYSYQGGQRIQNSVNAVLADMHEALGYDVDPATGNVAETNAPPPIAITGQGRRRYNVVRERILDPRTAASIRAQALRAGGVSTTDKATGYTTTIIPPGEAAAMNRLVDTTDRRYLAGELPSSALADGASPATIEERARAQVARQANIQDARRAAIEDYIRRNPGSQLAIEEAARLQNVTDRETRARVLAAERTPGTLEFDNRVFRNIRAGEARQRATERFIKANPNSMLAIKARKERWAARGQRAKRFAGGIVRIARNVLALTIGAILTAVTASVTLLTKSYQVISQIGNDIRKRAIDEAKYNFAPDTIRQFEIFAAQHPGLEKDLLVRAAGGIHAAWSTPLNYAESGFNQLAPYLREGTVKLVSMATADGDANILNIMGSVIDDLVQKSLSGVSGAKTFDAGSYEGRHRAFSGNVSALSAHNEAWGELMNQYWHDFIKSGASSIAGWTEKDKNGVTRTMTFENWVTQGGWSKEFDTNTGISSPVIRDAAEQTNNLLQQFIGTYSNLGRDIATAVSGGMGGVVEWLRNIVNNWLAPYFPAFAMKEDQRAIYLNQQSRALATNLLPGYEIAARSALLDIGYDYGLDEFKEVIDAMQRGDTSKIPYHIDLEALRRNMGAFTRYYHVKDVLARIEAEEEKAGKDRNYVQRAIIATPENVAAIAGEQEMILQHQLDKGTASIRTRPVEDDSQYTFSDYLVQLGIGLVNVPKFVGQAFQGVPKAFLTKIKRAQNSVEHEERGLERAYRIRQQEGRSPFGFNLSSREVGGVTAGDYRRLETAYRNLIKAYDEAGDSENALETLRKLRQFYTDWPRELVRVNPDERRRMNEQISRDTEWLWMGDNFARASQVLDPAELSALTYARIRQIEAQRAYAEEHGSRDSRGAQQQRTTHEITAAGFAGKIDQRMSEVFDTRRTPELQNMYSWLADRDNSVYVDAFNEATNQSMSDVIINFITDGVVQTSMRLPNTHGLMQDINLTQRAHIVRDMTPAFEAASKAQIGRN